MVVVGVFAQVFEVGVISWKCLMFAEGSESLGRDMINYVGLKL